MNNKPTKNLDLGANQDTSLPWHLGAKEYRLKGDDLGLGDERTQGIDRRKPQTGKNPGEADFTQLLLKALEGRSYCVRLRRGSSILELQNKIHNLLGIPEQGKNLIYKGRSLQDHYTLQEYNITTDSTIIINLRLRGGCSGISSKNTSSKNTGFFKDVVKGKGKAQVNTTTNPALPGPYIVE